MTSTAGISTARGLKIKKAGWQMAGAQMEIQADF